jgi:hypothetical protein
MINGEVFVLGGTDGRIPLNSVYSLSPETGNVVLTPTFFFFFFFFFLFFLFFLLPPITSSSYSSFLFLISSFSFSFSFSLVLLLFQSSYVFSPTFQVLLGFRTHFT